MTNRIIIAVAGIMLLAVASARAADMSAPVYRPAPVAVAAPYSWTGFYVGANAGWGWAKGSADAVLSGNAFANGSLGTGTADIDGAIVGGQIGGNYQTGAFVMGFELDGQWSGQRKEIVTACFAICTFNETLAVEAFGTGRLRIGAAFDRVLVYATGGAAWTSFKHTLTASGGGVTVSIFDASTSKIGWTAGGGFEVGFAGNWSAKFEYLYIQTSDVTLTAPFPAALGGGTITETAKVTDHIARVGINYRF